MYSFIWLDPVCKLYKQSCPCWILKRHWIQYTQRRIPQGALLLVRGQFIYTRKKKAIFIEISVKTLLVKGQHVRIIRLPSYCKDFECPPLFGAVFQNGQTRKTFVLLVLLLRKVKDINDDRIRTESGQIVTRNAYIFICMCMLQCRPLLVWA